jgi:hypothetical protein
MSFSIEEKTLPADLQKVEVEIPKDLLEEVKKFADIDGSISDLFLLVLTEYAKGKREQKSKPLENPSETMTVGAKHLAELKAAGLIGFAGHRNPDFTDKLREVAGRGGEALEELIEEQE